MKNLTTLLFLLFFSILAASEFVAIYFSYENYNWAVPGLLSLLALWNIFAVILFYYKNHVTAIILLLIIGGAIVPHQFYLHFKHLSIKAEAVSISNYVYQKKIATGQFPENIDDYNPDNKKVMSHIWYKLEEKDDFLIVYYVGTRNTAHYYRHSWENNWNYCDD